MSHYSGINSVAFVSGGASDPLHLAGTADPTAGGGVAAPEGSLYCRFVAGAGQVYYKMGAANTDWTLIPTSTAAAGVLAWGNSNIAASADTRFIDTWYNQATAPTVATANLVCPKAGTLSDLFVRHNVAAGNGNSVVYTVMVNGVATGITVTLATDAAGQASDLVNTAAVVAGDLVSLRAVKALSIAVGAQEVTSSLLLS